MQVVDIVFRNGCLVDGTGRPSFTGDVAIKDGLIQGIGPNLKVVAAREVDAAGKHVMPGWVDIHTHLDVQCMWDPLLSPSGPGGVTTVVMGSCGVGAAPTKKEGRDFMISTLSAVEDIPGDVIREGARWSTNGKDWESFAEYLDCLDSISSVCDIGTIVPHSCVRGYVLGPQRAALSDKPGGPWSDPLTLREKESIAACVRESVEAGALGFSTTRWWEHRDSEGVLCAGSLADADELVLCARAVAEGGGRVFQMHNDFKSYDDIPEDKMDMQLRKEHYKREWAWIRFIAKEYNLKVNWLGGGHRLDKLEAAAKEGLQLYHQVLVRPQSLIMTWQSRFHPFDSTRLFRRSIKRHPVSEWYSRLSDPQTRAEMISQIGAKCKEDSHFGRLLNQFWGPESKRWSTLYPMEADWDYEPAPERSLKAISETTGRSVFDLAYDAMMKNHGTGVIWQAQFPDVQAFYDHTQKNLQHPQIVPGVSDAGAHLAIFQDGTTPTSMISFWARDRSRGDKLPLELCVKKQARDTAYLYGLTDRGTLEVGKKADLNVVDMDALRIHLPEPAHDLPTGAYRWNQRVSGYEITMVSGVVTFEKGHHTGAFPGRVVRNQPSRDAKCECLADVPAEFSNYRVAAHSSEATTAEAVLESAMKAAGGASRMSTVSLALDKEARKEEVPQSKL